MRKLRGTIVSDKMDKTAVVAVSFLRTHRKYKKEYKATTRLKAHDEKNEYAVGDEVVIQEVRPLSKDKRWRIIERVSSKA